MAMLFGRRNTWEDDLEQRISRLSKELASLSKSVRSHGAQAYEDTRDNAADLYDDLADRVSDMMPEVRRQARYAQKTARENPVATAAVGLAVIGLAAMVLLRR